MAGFGYGAFGDLAFGAWDWDTYVLYRLLPEDDRNKDTDRTLAEFMDAVRPSIRAVKEGIDSFYNRVRTAQGAKVREEGEVSLRLGRVLGSQGALRQRGIDGVVAVGFPNIFSASTLRLSQTDLGAELALRSTVSANNGKKVVIAAILSSTSCLTLPPLSAPDAGMRWELRDPPSASSGTMTVEVLKGDVESIYPGHELFDGFSRFLVLDRRRFPLTTERQTLTLREGADGAIDGSGLLTSSKANFRRSDAGKRVVLARSGNLDNNRYYEIVRRVSSTSVELYPAPEVVPDSGPLFWAVLASPQIDLKTTVVPKGVVQQSGEDGSVALSSRFRSAGARFTANDIGKTIVIRDSSLGNDQVYTVASLNLPDALGFASEVNITPVPVANESNLSWELRETTLLGDATRVLSRPQDLLESLGKDFGIDLDQTSAPERRRNFLAYSEIWRGQKGHPDAYSLVGEAEGFHVQPRQLWRLTQELFTGGLFPADDLFEVQRNEEGSFGIDGTLRVFASVVQFEAGSALFSARDIGSHIRVADASTGANEKLYTIASVVSPTTVNFRPVDTASSLPDYGPGGTPTDPTIRWHLVRLYTDLPPQLPHFDELNADYLTDTVDTQTAGAKEFLVDKFAWESDYQSSFTVTGVSAAPVAGFSTTPAVTYEVVVSGPADIVLRVGHWKFVDAQGTSFFLESVPVASGPDWAFQVVATVSPVLVGPQPLRLEYVCPTQNFPDYMASNRVLVVVEADAVLGDPAGSQYDLFNRVLRKLEKEAKPQHVVLVPILKQTLSASLSLSAAVETP